MQKTDREKLEEIEQKINDLINSEEYKRLQRLNRWDKKNTAENNEDAKEDWNLLQEQLFLLREKERNWFEVIKSTSASQIKKQDSVGKGYKKEAATKSERAMLSTIAYHLYTKYEFETFYENPTFGDVMTATGFKNFKAIRNYFSLKKKSKESEPEKLEDYFTEQQWIYLVSLNLRVNVDLHLNLRKEKGGMTVLILEQDVYNPDLVTEIMLKTGVVKDACHLDIKDAASDSSRSQ